MSILNPKDLIKLANACRKAGIKHYKQGDIEFTLTDDLPQPQSRRVNTSKTDDSIEDFQTDTLTEDQLLFYSTIDLVEKEEIGT
jgi:hypothetical protein